MFSTKQQPVRRPSQHSAAQISMVQEMLRAGKSASTVSRATGMYVATVKYYKRKLASELHGTQQQPALKQTQRESVNSDSIESKLMDIYDREINQLELTIASSHAAIVASQTRLKEASLKRRRVARALGLLSDAAAEEE